ADGPRDQSRQAGDDHKFGRSYRSLTEELTEFTWLFTSPPKSLRGYVEDPNYPQVDYSENARSPRAFSFFRALDGLFRMNNIACADPPSAQVPQAGEGAQLRHKRAIGAWWARLPARSRSACR